MFETGVLASWVTLPTGQLLVGETLRRAIGSPTGPDTVAVLLALADSVRGEEERTLLADGWAKVAAWAAAQAVDPGVPPDALMVAGPAVSVGEDVGAGDVEGAFGSTPLIFPGRPGAVRDTAYVEHAAATEVIEQACTLPAGPEQVAALARIEPCLVVDDGPTLTGLIEAYERQISWLTARKLAAVADKHDATARAMRQHPDQLTDRWTRDGIAAGLHVAPATAAGWLWFARRLKVDFPGICTALTAGDLTVAQARAILEELPTGWDEATRADAETRLIQAGRRLPPARLRQKARALAIRLDPDGATRRRREHEQTNVGIDYRPLSEGLGQLSVVASAIDTQRLWQAIDTLARTRRAKRRVADDDGCGCPDNPTLGQDRVTALLDLTLSTTPGYAAGGGASNGATAGLPADDGTAADNDAATTGGVELTDAADASGAGAVSGPGDASGAGAVSGPGDASGAGAVSGPGDAGGASDGGVAEDAAGGIRLPGGPRTQVHVVIDLPTLLGLADNPAILQGYGPLDPDLARHLAAGADWIRWVTDPVTGHLLDDGDRRFPGHRLRRFIKARDPVCVVPGCHQPSRVADVDHVNGGYRATRRTAAATLVAACVGHNRTRDDAGWTATMRDDTSIEWTTTTGERHVVPPRRVLPDTPPPVPTVSLYDQDPPL